MGRWPSVTYAARASCFPGVGWVWGRRRRGGDAIYSWVAGGAREGKGGKGQGRRREASRLGLALAVGLGKADSQSRRGRREGGQRWVGWLGGRGGRRPGRPRWESFLGSLRLDAEFGVAGEGGEADGDGWLWPRARVGGLGGRLPAASARRAAARGYRRAGWNAGRPSVSGWAEIWTVRWGLGPSCLLD